jgi:tetrathionate reductase subunit B
MSTSDHTDLSRRSFLGGMAAAAGVTIAPGVLLYSTAGGAKPADEPVTSKVRWGLLIDANTCSGCGACVTACEKENGWGGPNSNEVHSNSQQKAQWIRTLTLKDKLSGHVQSLPMMCQHCEYPPCVDVCPTGASFRRADGIVLVDKHICIGCRYCMMACPYQARSFIHEKLTDQLPYNPRGKGCVESCNLCVHKVDAGDGTTACVEACNSQGEQAMWFGDLNDPNSGISQRLKRYGDYQVRADLGLNTGVRYQGLTD